MQAGAADAKRSKPGSLKASTVRGESVKYKAYSEDADSLLFAKVNLEGCWGFMPAHGSRPSLQQNKWPDWEEDWL